MENKIKTIGERTADEIKQIREKESSACIGSYFNNFRHRLPGGYYRLFPEYQKLCGDMDKILDDFKITPKMIADTKTRCKEKKDYLELHDLITPLYIKLREMGYKRYPDLVS